MVRNSSKLFEKLRPLVIIGIGFGAGGGAGTRRYSVTTTAGVGKRRYSVTIAPGAAGSADELFAVSLEEASPSFSITMGASGILEDDDDVTLVLV